MRPRVYLCSLLLLLLSTAPALAKVAPDLTERLATLADGETVDVVVLFGSQSAAGVAAQATAALRAAPPSGAMAQHQAVVASLRRQAASLPHQAARLQGLGATVTRHLWLVNGLALRAPRKLVTALATWPEVREILLDAEVRRLPPATADNAALAPTEPPPPGWNLRQIKADRLWSRGLGGRGVTVAAMDSGVAPGHPDLMGRNRPTVFWYDTLSALSQPAETDASGLRNHGTAVLSLMVGGNATGTTVGVAPEAKWLAVRLFDAQGVARVSNVLEGWGWLLDPDNTPATADAPVVVNNSWGFTDRVGQCAHPLGDAIAAMKEAGVAMVFAAGNSGPNVSTSVSPGNNPGALAVGYVDSNATITPSSSRGPSACDGSIYPHLVAPGDGVLAAATDWVPAIPATYLVPMSGSSFAAAQLSGAVALLRAALPSATVAQVDQALRESARDLGGAGPDNVYGQGLLDVEKAYDRLLTLRQACRGDLNGDGVVNQADVTLWQQAMQAPQDCVAIGCLADVNFDGRVDLNDLRILRSDAARTCPPR